MKPDDGDLLIHRHLEGALSEADAAALGALIKGDAAFRRRLAEMAFERAQMKDILSSPVTEAVPVLSPPAAPRVSRRALVPMAAAAIIVASVGVAVAMWSFRDRPVENTGTNAAKPAPEVDREPVLPKDPYRGFAGPVVGKVVNRTETALRFRVVAVPGQGPGALRVGTVIQVGPGYTKNAKRETVPDGLHPNFIRMLEPDQEETLDLRHVTDDFFVIGELTPAQQEWARGRGDGRKRPAEGREDPPKRVPERPRKEAGKEVPRDGQDREGPPKERPKEE